MGRTRQEDATAQARQWAAENPITAEACGVRLALDCATRWKAARDVLLVQRAADEKLTHRLFVELKRLLEHVKAMDSTPASMEPVINDADTVVRQAVAAGWRAQF